MAGRTYPSLIHYRLPFISIVPITKLTFCIRFPQTPMAITKSNHWWKSGFVCSDFDRSQSDRIACSVYSDCVRFANSTVLFHVPHTSPDSDKLHWTLSLLPPHTIDQHPLYEGTLSRLPSSKMELNSIRQDLLQWCVTKKFDRAVTDASVDYDSDDTVSVLGDFDCVDVVHNREVNVCFISLLGFSLHILIPITQPTPTHC
jgi:hypothetical protein